MDFGRYVKKVGPGAVRVVAEARLNGQDDDFGTADLPFDAGGKAVPEVP